MGSMLKKRARTLRWCKVYKAITLVVLSVFIIAQSVKYTQSHSDKFWLKFKAKEPSSDEQRKFSTLSQKKLDTRVDGPFQYGCAEPNVQDQPRANAAFVMLCRNSEIKDVIKSVESMERHFNQWFNYPWVFLNNEPFTDEFKTVVEDHTESKVSFGLIEMSDWEFDSDLDPDELYEWMESQGDRSLLYGNLQSYHKMCRFYSGKFFAHPLVKSLDWYWRVEPDVEFFCDLTYDPFIEMEKRGKKYGFNVMITDLYYSIPGLFRVVQNYVKKNKITPKSSWELFTSKSKWVVEDDPEGIYDGIYEERDIKTEIQDQIYLHKFLHEEKDKKESVFQKYEYMMQRIFAQSAKMPQIYEDRMNQEDYNFCHFWSNFEIARVDIFSSPEYQQLYQHLEASGGFYKERWGDAPVHSLALGLLLDMQEIHYFRDIGYRHDILVHCPANAPGKQLEYQPSRGLKYKGDDHKLKSDMPRFNGVGCRCKCPSWFKEMENSPCMKKWALFTHDEYQRKQPVNIERTKKRISRKIDRHLFAGGKYGDMVI
ncbi:uncharacterized protein LODBEIA_P14700 [Lodderomyces beijingensis]|uniref:Mannosyltransferase n=1 Tax=Lodderomyces beijingensis TaxID=1775926 RepID=A0ABP0ZK43_9ASCO